MAVHLNHTIVAARDKQASAEWLARILGLPAPTHFGPFAMVQPENDVTLDFADTTDEITVQHYAFLVSEPEFDEIFARVKAEGEYWADPYRKEPGQINTRDGGRGVYFLDPNGHVMEILTRPYGSGDQ
jgi:catechol 2,3-dioxygenase-like lactoylglutathione lyase family enzyme